MTDRPLLTVENVSFSFGDHRVLDSVSMTAASDSVVCLVGPNGSGKTTLLRLLAGLLSPEEGQTETRASSSRAVGYLAQAPSFRPQFSVRETLSFYAALVPESVDVTDTLERVGLGGVPERRVEALSGGMTRLLGIAQATIGDPSLLVLDEPSSGLDPMMTRHITEVIDTLASEGDAVVLSTHDLTAAERVADTVVVLDRGRIVAADSPTVLCRETDTETLESAMSELVAYDSGVVVTQKDATSAAPDEVSR